MDQRWDEKSVFLEALRLPEARRAVYLGEACPNDAARNRIESLLRHHAQAPDCFLAAVTETMEIPANLPRQIDEFQIQRVLGEGGMGMVYLAEDTVLRRKVALKVLARHLTGHEKALDRFREEARSTAALNHAAIVPVFKFGRQQDQCYLVSEFVDGPTLTELIEKQIELRGTTKSQQIKAWHRRAVEIIATVADALDCAHRANIVHRDVKPSNILIDPQRGPRLTDFGVAKHLSQDEQAEHTEHTGIIGSCHYMSPEQASIAGTRVDQRSDIFSLGTVMYETIALRRPFEGSDVHQVLRAVIEVNPPRLRSIDRTVPVDLETICYKAMEKSPQDRYQTAAHMAADLRCALAGDPILARPPGLGRRIARFIRRRRGPVVLAVLAFLLSSVAVLGRWYVEASRQSLASVAISADRPGSVVLASLFDRASLELGPAQQLGTVPIQEMYLEPGHYRFTIVAPDGAFTEVHQHLKPGSYAIDAHLARPAGDPNAMVAFGPGKLPVNWSLDPAQAVAREVDVPAFYLDRREVSNAEYKKFVEATGHRMPDHWQQFEYDEALAHRPVIGINQSDAEAYAQWAGKRLPTLLEWQFAARSPDNRTYPWGDNLADAPADFEPDCQILRSSLARTLKAHYDAYAAHTVETDLGEPNQSGLLHVYDNVREYTANLDLTRDEAPIVAGACWSDVPEHHDLSAHRTRPSAPVSYNTGFRCARSKEPISITTSTN